MTPRGKVRDHSHQDPLALSLKRLSLAPDSPWVKLPAFVCLEPLFGRGLLPKWELFAGERHQEFIGQSADNEEPDGREKRWISTASSASTSLMIPLGFLLTRTDQHIRQSMQRNLWRLSWTIRNLFNGVGRHVRDASDRQAEIAPDERSNEHALAAVSRDRLSFPVLRRRIETSVNVPVLPVPNHLEEKGNRSVEFPSPREKSRVGQGLDRIDETPEHARDAIFSYRLFGKTIERLVATETPGWGTTAKSDGVSTRRGILQPPQIQYGRHTGGRSTEISETQKTITRLLSMANETTEAQTNQKHHQALKDLETKIEGMQDLNRSDLQMLRHMVQTLAEKLDRQPRIQPVPRMKRWSFYGPL